MLTRAASRFTFPRSSFPGNEPSHQQQRFSNVYHAMASPTTPARARKQAVKVEMPQVDLVKDERGEAYYGMCVMMC